MPISAATSSQPETSETLPVDESAGSHSATAGSVLSFYIYLYSCLSAAVSFSVHVCKINYHVVQ